MSDEAKPTEEAKPAPRTPLFEMVGPLPELFSALSKAQGEFPEIVKDMTANAGKFKYDYADLALVLRKIRPALVANGLALINPLAGGTASGFMVRTMLLHSSGAYMSSTTIIPYQDDPQEFGIRVTYQRRYGDLAMVGVFPTAEDTDGKKQETAPREAQDATRRGPPPLPAQAAKAPEAKADPKPVESKAAELSRKQPEEPTITQVDDGPSSPELKLDIRVAMLALRLDGPSVVRKLVSCFGPGVTVPQIAESRMKSQKLLDFLMADVDLIPGLVARLPEIRSEQLRLSGAGR